MTGLTPKQEFALEEFRSLRREIDGQEEILDRIFKRALAIVSICYLVLIFRYLPFSGKPIEVPKQVQDLLQYAPLVVVVVFWIDYSSRYQHLKILAGYIEHIEADFYGGDRDGWEKYLRLSEDKSFLRRKRHNVKWILLLAGTLVVSLRITEVAVP